MHLECLNPSTIFNSCSKNFYYLQQDINYSNKLYFNEIDTTGNNIISNSAKKFYYTERMVRGTPACYYLFIFLPHKFQFVSIKTVMIFVSTHVRDTYKNLKIENVSQRKLKIKTYLPIWHLRLVYSLRLVKKYFH